MIHVGGAVICFCGDIPPLASSLMGGDAGIITDHSIVNATPASALFAESTAGRECRREQCRH